MERQKIDQISHEKCRDCDYAVYCYTKPSLWVFRTQEEMERKIAYMKLCPIRKSLQEADRDINNIPKESTA
jgi:hypothetical protein